VRGQKVSAFDKTSFCSLLPYSTTLFWSFLQSHGKVRSVCRLSTRIGPCPILCLRSSNDNSLGRRKFQTSTTTRREYQWRRRQWWNPIFNPYPCNNWRTHALSVNEYCGTSRKCAWWTLRIVSTRSFRRMVSNLGCQCHSHFVATSTDMSSLHAVLWSHLK
jgi:hypothetical protein